MPAKIFYVFYLKVAITFSFFFLYVNMCVYIYICLHKFLKEY